jgi:hypothetical protein
MASFSCGLFPRVLWAQALRLVRDMLVMVLKTGNDGNEAIRAKVQ